MKCIKYCFLFITVVFCGCSKDPSISNGGEQSIVVQLPSIPNISLSYHATSEEVKLARDVQSEGAKVSLKSGAPWIKNLTLTKDRITFDVSINPDVLNGHRFDTILVKIGVDRIGTICVSQARKPISGSSMQWCTGDASLYDDEGQKLPNGFSGLEATKYIYNLEKTTNGKDHYKQYPAFAYCIEMNHDPANKMEWYLPGDEEMARQNDKDFDWFGEHTFWTANEHNSTYAFIYRNDIGTTSKDKKSKYYVCAFRNGIYEP